jgi:hypothetical protein
MFRINKRAFICSFRPVVTLTAAITLVAAVACDQSPTSPLSPRGAPGKDVTALSASYIVDTGPGGTSSIGYPSLFSAGSTTCSPQPQCAASFQYLGGKFTLANETNVESLEGWMSITSGGNVAVHIRIDSTTSTSLHIPGHSLQSATYTVSPQGFAWKVFSNFVVNLAAGTYWVTFEPVANSGVQANMSGGAASPLADYAFFADGNNRWVPYSAFNQNPGLGMRVFGTEVLPPPPSDADEMIGDLKTYINGASMPKGNAQSINSKLDLALSALDTDQISTACTYLQDAINYTRAQSGKKIPAATATEIITQINAIRTEIGC